MTSCVIGMTTELFRDQFTVQLRSRICQWYLLLTDSSQFTGQPTIVYYASTIFQALGFQSGEKATLASLGIGLAKV